MSRSPLASMIFTEVFFNSGRFDRASCVAASTGGPRIRQDRRQPGRPAGLARGTARQRALGAESSSLYAASLAGIGKHGHRIRPADRRRLQRRDVECRRDMKIAPFTPTPFGP